MIALKVVPDQADTTDPLSPSKSVLKHREKRINLDGSTTKSTANFLTARGESVSAKLINVSRFGGRIEVLAENLVLETGEEIEKVEFYLGDSLIYSGSATIANQIKHGSGPTHFGLALQNDGIDTDRVTAILQIDSEFKTIGSTKTILELSQNVLPEFKALVADLSTLLLDLKGRLLVEQERIDQLATSDNHQRRLEEQTISLALALYREDIHRIFEAFGKVTKNLDFDSALIHKRYFRVNFHPNVIGAPFIKRGFTKPLGHAGDFGLMVMLYEYADIGGNLFEKFFHRFCCNEPAAVANKNRVVLLADLIHGEYVKTLKNKRNSFKLASLACGPAREVQLFLDGMDDPKGTIEVICVDQEGHALDHAIDRIRRLSTSRKGVVPTFIREDAVLGLIKRRKFSEELLGSNVITCAGLFDYLSDRLASRIIEIMFDMLSPSGVLLIGNVSDKNPDRFSMDYFMEWNLVLRSEQDLENLVPPAIRSIQNVSIEVVSEPLGLNLFLKIRKPETSSGRERASS